jgi:hypothetical protein
VEGFLVLSIITAAVALLGSMATRFGVDTRTDAGDVRGTSSIGV